MTFVAISGAWIATGEYSNPRIDAINRGLSPSLNDERLFLDPCLKPGQAFMKGHDAAAIQAGLSPTDPVSDNERVPDNLLQAAYEDVYWAPENFATYYLNKAAFKAPRDSFLGFWTDPWFAEPPSCPQ